MTEFEYRLKNLNLSSCQDFEPWEVSIQFIIAVSTNFVKGNYLWLTDSFMQVLCEEFLSSFTDLNLLLFVTFILEDTSFNLLLCLSCSSDVPLIFHLSFKSYHAQNQHRSSYSFTVSTS